MHRPKTLLNGLQKKQLNQALRNIFTLRQFDTMLDEYLKINREDIILEYHIGLEELFGKVIEEIDRQGNTPVLLDVALKERPNDKQLFVVAQQFDFPIKTSAVVMERIIDPKNPYVDAEPWLGRLYQLLSQVCSIEEKGKHVGTGFLVGPCIIMTNYHVVQSFINENRLPTEITCRFDCRVMADGTTINEGVQYRLAKEGWRIDYSPYHPMEFKMPDVEPSPDQLDYALLRFEDIPNDQLHYPTHELSKRGWIELCTSEYSFQQDTSLFILHHPKPPPYAFYAPKVPLKLSLDTHTVLRENKNKTRVYYGTNTDAGSSGGACFTSAWRLVALHHAGDPSQNPQYNQGIPIVTILQRLAREDKLRFLALDSSIIANLHSTFSSLDNSQPRTEISPPSVFPQSTSFITIPISFTERIRSVLDTIHCIIETARRPFADEGNVRRSQYKNTSKNLQEIEKQLQSLEILVNSNERLPSGFSDRETIGTDISIADTHRKALIQLLDDFQSYQSIQDGFSELEKALNRIKKDLSETKVQLY